MNIPLFTQGFGFPKLLDTTFRWINAILQFQRYIEIMLLDWLNIFWNFYSGLEKFGL